ncbi:MAG: hypothetical protein EZS28_000682 [Streblomastix strix]|uniref:Uncharacterized protein n=1 Tax=Streblomastix strix TaxID=222440 RepID=A0A5J4XBB9_9EUKA|nr:MAG: hypothetical protein EZS28_000682 [Streblomastix strix]
MVQTYDNSSVVCASGGVRSIADIQSASYSKSEDDVLLLLKADKSITYTKTEDDDLILLKDDKTQLIDSQIKGETNNLLNNKADNGVSYTKDEDDALLLLKADETQLIDSYTKGETNNLLDYKANQLTTYIKTETDYFISQIDVGDVDLTDYYNKTKTDKLLSEKADSDYVIANFVQIILYFLLRADGTKPISEFGGTIDDSNYVKKDGDVQDIQGILRKTILDQPYPEPTDDEYITLGVVKREFVSSIYSGSISGNLTAAQFIKSGGTDQQVFLTNGKTKPLSEFTGTPTDLSNYYTKKQTYLQTEANNKFVRLEGSIQQTITERLKCVSPIEYQDETQDHVANTYLTMSEVDAKLTNVVTINTTQSINGTKTFNANVSATGFVKTGKDDTSVLLAGGGDRQLSSFGGIEDLTSSAFSGMNSAVIQYKLIRTGNLNIFSLLANGGNFNVGTFNPDYLVQDDVAVITYIPFPNNTVDKGGYVIITHSIGLITCKSTTNTYIQCASATWVK